MSYQALDGTVSVAELGPIAGEAARRRGAAAFVLGHLLFVINKLDEIGARLLHVRWPDPISGENTLLILIGQLAMIAGHIALYRFYAPRAGRLAKAGLRLLGGGGLLLAVGHVNFMTGLAVQQDILEPFFVLVFVGVLLMLLGLLIVGLANLRRPLMARWTWLPLATGLAGATAFIGYADEEINTGFLVFRTLFGLGLMGMGWGLWLESSDSAHRDGGLLVVQPETRSGSPLDIGSVDLGLATDEILSDIEAGRRPA